jgi:hypothetical protein
MISHNVIAAQSSSNRNESADCTLQDSLHASRLYVSAKILAASQAMSCIHKNSFGWLAVVISLPDTKSRG